MAPALSLLDPPALHQPNPSLNRNFFSILLSHIPSPLSQPINTVKGVQTFKSSLPPLDPCTEFLVEAITPPQTEDLTQYERQAWKHDPLTTLKLPCSLRIMGKLENDGFCKAMLWVHKNHPLTMYLNAMAFGGVAMFKDSLGILYRVLEDSMHI